MNLPNPLTGTGLLVSWLNKVREFVKSKQILPGPGYRIRQLPGGIVLDIIPKGGGKGGAGNDQCPYA